MAKFKVVITSSIDPENRAIECIDEQDGYVQYYERVKAFSAYLAIKEGPIKATLSLKEGVKVLKKITLTSKS